jgi:hypothetical protein
MNTPSTGADGARSRAGHLRTAYPRHAGTNAESRLTSCTNTTAWRRKLVLEFCHPRQMRLEEPPSEPHIQQQVLPPVRQRFSHRFRFVEPRRDVGDLCPKGRNARAHSFLADEVSGEDTRDPLVVHARKRGRLAPPLAQGGKPLLRQGVVRSFTGLARLLPCPQVSEALEPFWLRVVLADGTVGVDPAPARHPDEVVRPGAVPSDEGQDAVRKCRELLP